MKYVKLGTLDVGRIGLGAMGMSAAYTGAGRDDAESIRTIHRALDLGVTLIDTAEVYSPHTNEELVGRALARAIDGRPVPGARTVSLFGERGEASRLPVITGWFPPVPDSVRLPGADRRPAWRVREADEDTRTLSAKADMRHRFTF
jgi:Aldo/keto reductase family